MRKPGRHLLRLAAFITALHWVGLASACNVPVFRYALERWETDPYQIVVFHREPLSAEQQSLVQQMERAGQEGRANLTVSRVDLAAAVAPTWRTVWSAQVKPSLPWMVVAYPRQFRNEKPVWAGPLNAETVGALLDSPLRRDIAQRLLAGDAVVWLLLESGDAKLDTQAEGLVESETRKLQQTLKLPERLPQDPPISSDVPLKIAFSTVRVAPADPAEHLLVSMLLNQDPALATVKTPMLFPIFGRGRAIPPAIGQEIRADSIREMAEFLTGPCSCQVKDLNPGYDLLLSANWNSLAGYQEVLLPDPPPLVSMSGFAANALSNVPSATAKPEVAPPAASPPIAPGRTDHLGHNLIAITGISIALLAAATFGLKVRTSRRPR